MAKSPVPAKTDMMTIAFAHGGILPTEVTGGAEQPVPAHKAVEVPRAYGQHLVDDRFAYQPKAQRHDDKPPGVTRAQLDKELVGRREALAKETDPTKRAALEAKIAEVEAQMSGLPA